MKTRWQTPTTSRNIHHHLLLAVWTRQEKNIVKLNNVIKSFLNPMTRDDEELINIITKLTKVVMLPQVKNTCAAEMRLTSSNTQLLMMNASTRQKSISGQE